MSPTLPMTIVKRPMAKENCNIKSIIPSFLHLFYLDIVLVHDSGLHLLWTKAAVQVCGVVRVEVGGVVGQGLEEAGAVQVATLPSHTTEANNKQFYSLLVTTVKVDYYQTLF